ncbi:MAG TPA: endonuclease III [Candidatus Nanoarchaeia archaeon]|nr:endonuclease III [Candidatus Nanoarchaeia archaeon]
MKESEIIDVLEILTKKYPSSSQTTLNRMRKKPDAFKVLIACLLSLRARDENTEKVSKALFKVAKTPQAIASMPTKKLEKIIFSSGHYHKKARALKHVSKELIKRFNSKVPNTREGLLSIKHIGPKTANIVLAFAFGQCVIPVDTHCHKISNRLGWVQTKLAEKIEIELMKIIPDKYKCEFNAVFVQFGRDICVPISPKCSVCPISKYCKRIGVTRSR